MGALNPCYLPFEPDEAAGAGAGAEDEFELFEFDDEALAPLLLELEEPADGVVADPLFEELEDEEPASGVAGIGGGGAAFWVAAGALWLPLLCSADCCFEQATSAKPTVAIMSNFFILLLL
ncbi:MAG: hypothetical protein RXQ72_00500 [Hydrogenobaculum sp.]